MWSLVSSERPEGHEGIPRSRISLTPHGPQEVFTKYSVSTVQGLRGNCTSSHAPSPTANSSLCQALQEAVYDVQLVPSDSRVVPRRESRSATWSRLHARHPSKTFACQFSWSRPMSKAVVMPISQTETLRWSVPNW